MIAKKLWMGLMMGCCALGFQAAHGHGAPTPQHGGVVQVVDDVGFELVAAGDTAVLYITDHGMPVPVEGMTGKLTVLSGSQKTEADLAVAGKTLEAKGIKLPSGAKAVATITNAEKKTLTVRFTIK
jgi:hypothetical protein